MIRLTDISQSDVNTLLGVTTNTIRNWETTDWGEFPGPFPKCKKSGTKNLYDWKACLTWYVRYKIVTDYKDMMHTEVKPDDVDFGFWKARKMKADAQTSETELEQAQQKLVSIEEVEQVWTHATTRVKAKFMTVPSRLGALLHDGQSAAEREDVIDTEIRYILSELSEVV